MSSGQGSTGSRWRLTGYQAWLGALLLVSAVLRAVLVFRGGQYFWPDENRYNAALEAWRLWGAGQWREGALQIFRAGDHLGYKVVMLAPAWVHRHWPDKIQIPSLFLSLFSVANIAWVWRIAKRLGADEHEAFWAATAMAASVSMAYWARHLMPYDVAMFWALTCLYAGLAPHPRPFHSVLVGLLGFAAFVTYLGYWAMVGCALVTHVLWAWPDRRALARRAALALLGSAGSFGLLIVGTRAIGGSLMSSLQTFASAVTQGDFNQGHVVFFDYLWSAERVSALIWAVALVGFGVLAKRADRPTRTRGLVAATSIVALATILVVGANVFHTFVVYGRLVRQVVPFCALLVGWTAARVFRERPWSWGERVTLLALLVAGTVQMRHPLWQEFPGEFVPREHAFIAQYRRTHAEAEAKGPAQIRGFYDYFIWPYPREPAISPRSEVLLTSAHPMQWRPYLFEGFNRDQRREVRRTDITMRLVLVRD
jgi:hypothetical protein